MPRDLICLMCPNGCHLTIDVQGDQRIELQGNLCDKGVDFARTVLDSLNVKTPVRGDSAVYSEAELKRIASFWGISLKTVCPRLIPEGSPERTLFRVVIEDALGAYYVLEQIPASVYLAKMRIIQSLEYLSRNGLASITPYRADSEGRYIRKVDRGLWQLVPYIHGVPLDRETYLYEGWRADVLSRFLIELREKSRGIPFFSLEDPFSIKNYIHALVRQIDRHAPEIMPRIIPVLAFLEKRFMGVCDSLPVGFCHGDYHPLNIVWGTEEILSVIDWEFLGIKPEIYDLVNMVGCLGIEHPSSLVGDLVRKLIARLRAADLYSDVSWRHFLEFVVAMRFAWLSEWLRKDDREMIGLELDYMDLLIQNRDVLVREWTG
ncbi:MAG TPA: phosphotransferase [Syntrophales bacterium]|nr:phosphotransferase [Syntrophales bacterium]